MSGWPMFKWYTCTPLALAARAWGTSLRMGEAGTAALRLDRVGIDLTMMTGEPPVKAAARGRLLNRRGKNSHKPPGLERVDSRP